MSLSNTNTTYGSVTKALHWLTALLILTVIPLGVIAHEMGYDTSDQLSRKALLFSLHKTVGVTIFFVALIRIGWAFSQTKPGLLNAEKPAESFLAQLVHWMLYASLVIVPLSGWVHHASTEGFAPIWWPFGQDLPFIPKSESLAHVTATFHMVFERVMVISLLLHIAGALKHHFVDKDATLRRMWFGNGSMPNVIATPHSKAPIGAAVAIYAVVIGAVLATTDQTARAPTPVLAAVASDWQVESGTIEITVEQFGSAVTGQFSDWTAAIAYDPESREGSTEVTISIPSLTLGSVTEQAMGPDFFDSQNFPTATFSGLIRAEAEEHVLTGTLSLKGLQAPIEMPFELTLNDSLATAKGQISLNRQDFNIGESMVDESSLGFGVDVVISLTARQQ